MQNIDFVLEPIRGFLQQTGAFLPRLGVAVGVLIAGWLLAKAARFSIVKAMRALNFHVLSERAGIDGFLQQGGTERDTTDLFGLVVFWLVMLAALIIAFNGLGLGQVTELLGKVALFLPRVLLVLLVIVFGSYFARFVGGAVQGYCRSAGISDGELLGRIVQYVIMTFVLLLAVDHLEIGHGLIQQTFLILLAGVVFAVALAVGLGARDRAARLIDRWFPREGSDGS
jgi:hypothetical protein